MQEPPVDPKGYKSWKLKIRLMTIPHTNWFQVTLQVAELIYFAVLCTLHWEQSSLFSAIQGFVGVLLIVLMLLDVLLVVWSMGWKLYIAERLNVFKFFTLVVSLVFFCLAVTGILEGFPYGLARVLWLPLILAMTWRYYMVLDETGRAILSVFTTTPYRVFQVDPLLPLPIPECSQGALW